MLPEFMRAIIRATWLCEGAGEMYVALDETSTLVGYSQWIPPGRDLWDSCVGVPVSSFASRRSPFYREDQRQLGHYEFKAKLSDEGKKYFDESVNCTPDYVLRIEY